MKVFSIQDFCDILLRAGLGLGADSGSPRAGQLLLVVRRRRWRGLSPSIGAELGGCGGPGGEKPSNHNDSQLKIPLISLPNE